MTGIVAAEVGAWGLRLFFHDGKSFRTEDVPFSPFVLLNAETAIPENCTIEPLSGSGFFCRMAFFADAVSHSAFAGAALGLLFFGANGPLWTMPLLAVVIEIGRAHV